VNIKKIADEIEKDWFGPNGQVWCKDKQKYITPDSCTSCNPECSTLRSQDIRQFRYLHLTDNYKSY
jgi:hypothetical protein